MKDGKFHGKLVACGQNEKCMGIKKILVNLLGEKRYLSLLAGAFQRLYPTGKLGLIYQDVYFLKHIVEKGACCVDIGAHLGYYTLEMSRLAGPSGKIIAIEPMPGFNEVLENLLRRKKANNVELMQVALGGEGDYVEMGIPRVGNNKQFAYARIKRAGEPYVYVESVKVRNASGDALFSGLPRLDFIKCDVEGLEIQVFTSMMETLRKHRPILLAELVDKGERIRFFEMIRPMGYEVFYLVSGKLRPLDIYGDVFPVSHNHYFIPDGRKRRLKEVMAG
jgi:FkbM family methyltransferase